MLLELKNLQYEYKDSRIFALEAYRKTFVLKFGKKNMKNSSTQQWLTRALILHEICDVRKI